MPEELEIPITEFNGPYKFLSNFSRDSFEWRGILWDTSEHAYQAVKTATDEEFYWVRTADGPGEAKRRGRAIRCRDDWEDIKEEVMLIILRSKFAPGTELAKRLTATGNAELVEGDRWHDCTWGVCNCPKCGGKGKNLLGKTLMKIRAELEERNNDSG